ncbi:unnamed protein product, partial [Ectocarpus fasciculatus]
MHTAVRRAGGICMSAGKTIEMYMPALSSTMEEGTIVQWLKDVGDKIEVGDPVMVVESDKADMDVESFEEGYLAAVLTEEGDSAKVGAAVALIVESEEDIAAAQAAGPSAAGGAAPAESADTAAAPAGGGGGAAKPDVPFKEIGMPALSSTMTEGKVVAWLKQEGDKVEMGEAVLVVESDKADMDVESYDEGYLAAIITGCGRPYRSPGRHRRRHPRRAGVRPGPQERGGGCRSRVAPSGSRSRSGCVGTGCCLRRHPGRFLGWACGGIR